MKILIVSYYELKDSLLSAANALKNLGITVINYPLYQYAHDTHDKKENYADHMEEFILINNPDTILWWYFGIPTENMKLICGKSTKHIMFNWDEPYNWNLNDIENKAHLFNSVFLCSSEKFDEYKKYGTKNAHLLYPGYDSNIYYPTNIDYKCDISICCTNLYINYPNQFIDRKVLIDAIYENQEKYQYVFHIYGPKSFQTLYPKSYQGYAKYNDGNIIYNSSRINLSTHVQSNAKKYLNERTINILGAGGLLLVDRTTDIEDVLEGGCIFIKKEGYIEQIVEILKNYDNYKNIKERGYEISKLYTWDKWAEHIRDNIE
jgi:hypothetical protein